MWRFKSSLVYKPGKLLCDRVRGSSKEWWGTHWALVMQGSTPSSSTMQVTSEWNDHVGMMNVQCEQVTALTRIVNMFTSDEKVHQHTWLIPLHFNNPSTNTINRVIIKNIELALQYLKFPCLYRSEVLCLSSDPNLVVQTFRKKILQHRIIGTFQYAMQLRKNVWRHKYQKPSSVLKAFRAWGVRKGCDVCCSGWARYMQL